MTEITRVLNQIEDGDPSASEKLLPLVYRELRQLATHRLASERAGQTLQPTALVHEAFIRLVDGHEERQWDSRGHFFSAAAEAMRRILVELARKKQRNKHGGEWNRIEFHDAFAVEGDRAKQVLAINDALDSLAETDPKKAELVKLRFFAGMQMAEAAKVLGVSEVTAARYWQFARAWLFDHLQQGN